MQDCHSCDPGSIPGAGAKKPSKSTDLDYNRVSLYTLVILHFQESIMSNKKYTVEIADSTGHSVVEMTKQEISDKVQSSKGSWLFVDNRLVDVDILPEIDLSTDSKVRIMPGIVGGMNNEKIRVEVADSTGHSVIDMSRNDLVKMSQTNGSWVFVNDQLVSAHEIAKMDFDNETKVRAMPGLIGGL